MLADYGFGRADVTGPGVTCDAISAGWQWLGGELKLQVAGPCTFANGEEAAQFIVEAVATAGAFAGTVVVAPTF